jgi:hypothetical protein
MTLAEAMLQWQNVRFSGSEHSISPEIYKLHFAQGCVSAAVDGNYWLPVVLYSS